MEEIIIKVKGMSCGGCENRIKNILNEIEGIEQVEANHQTGIVTIKINQEVENNIIKEKIENIGFEVVQDN